MHLISIHTELYADHYRRVGLDESIADTNDEQGPPNEQNQQHKECAPHEDLNQQTLSIPQLTGGVLAEGRNKIIR